MGQREDIVKMAVSQIGYKEKSGNYTKYGSWYGMDGNPWCAMFVSWCANQVNISTSKILKFAYVPYGVTFFKNLKQYYQRSSGYKPQPGDIIFFGTSSHVGIVETCDGTKLTTIEGNTSNGINSSNGDGCYRRNRRLSDRWIMGYGIPEYEDNMEIKTIEVKHSELGMVELQSVNVKGENFVRLRDMEKIAPIDVDWNGEYPTVKMNYKK